jgi:hypothetical protein
MIKPGKPIEETVDLIIEVKPTGNVIDELEEHTIAERPDARGVAPPAQTASLRGALGL